MPSSCGTWFSHVYLKPKTGLRQSVLISSTIFIGMSSTRFQRGAILQIARLQVFVVIVFLLLLFLAAGTDFCRLQNNINHFLNSFI